MKNSYPTQKKKTTANTISRILFKILVVVAVLIFAYIILDKTTFSSSTVSMGGIKKTQPSSDVPGPLRWHDSFKGIENVPNKKQKEKKEKSSGGGGSSTGFNFQGFGK